jgi:hypothetical protein
MQEAAKNGDVEMVQQYQEALDAAYNKSGKEESAKGLSAAASDVGLAMRKEGGAMYSTSSGKVTNNVGTNTWGISTDNDKAALAVLEEANVDGLLGTAHKKNNGELTSFDLELDTNDGAKFVEQYQALQDTLVKLKEKGLENSMTYMEIEKMLKASEESYAKLDEANKEY